MINNEDKIVRKAVRSFLIKDNNILGIKYNEGSNKDYLDIPGGKIEDNETSFETSIREFKEETGVIVKEQKYRGKLIINYPDRIFEMEIFEVLKYEGENSNFLENDSMWINIDKILNKEKILPSILIIKDIMEYSNELKINIIVDKNHKIIKIEKGE